MKSGHVFPMGFPTLAAALQRWSQHLSGSWHSPPAFLFWFRCPPSPGPFRPWGGTEPALPNSFSFLSQGTALDVVAFLHPAHFFVNCPFIKFPSNYHDLNLGSIPGSGRSAGEGNGNPLLLPGKSHGQRSMVRYSPWGHKESDMTEWLHFHFTMI